MSDFELILPMLGVAGPSSGEEAVVTVEISADPVERPESDERAVVDDLEAGRKGEDREGEDPAGKSPAGSDPPTPSTPTLHPNDGTLEDGHHLEDDGHHSEDDGTLDDGHHSEDEVDRGFESSEDEAPPAPIHPRGDGFYPFIDACTSAWAWVPAMAEANPPLLASLLLLGSGLFFAPDTECRLTWLVLFHLFVSGGRDEHGVSYFLMVLAFAYAQTPAVVGLLLFTWLTQPLRSGERLTFARMVEPLISPLFITLFLGPTQVGTLALLAVVKSEILVAAAARLEGVQVPKSLRHGYAFVSLGALFVARLIGVGLIGGMLLSTLPPLVPSAYFSFKIVALAYDNIDAWPALYGRYRTLDAYVAKWIKVFEMTTHGLSWFETVQKMPWREVGELLTKQA